METVLFLVYVALGNQTLSLYSITQSAVICFWAAWSALEPHHSPFWQHKHSEASALLTSHSILLIRLHLLFSLLCSEGSIISTLPSSYEGINGYIIFATFSSSLQNSESILLSLANPSTQALDWTLLCLFWVIASMLQLCPLQYSPGFSIRAKLPPFIFPLLLCWTGLCKLG